MLFCYSCGTVSNKNGKADSDNAIANSQSVQQGKNGLAIYDSNKAKQNETGNPNEKSSSDSTFTVGDLLFVGNKKMKFGFFQNKKPIPKSKRVSKGDTLYHDEKCTLLGDLGDLSDYRIYRKYRNHFSFSDFPVDSIYKGKLAKPDFKTDLAARHFRTMIRKGCAYDGVNFAGHFTIAQWGCGCMCQQMAIVDRTNGEIYYSIIPFDTMDGHYGVRFKIDSKMIIVNSGLLDDADDWEHKGYYNSAYGLRPSTYEWRDSVFVKID